MLLNVSPVNMVEAQFWLVLQIMTEAQTFHYYVLHTSRKVLSQYQPTSMHQPPSDQIHSSDSFSGAT